MLSIPEYEFFVLFILRVDVIDNGVLVLDFVVVGNNAYDPAAVLRPIPPAKVGPPNKIFTHTTRNKRTHCIYGETVGRCTAPFELLFDFPFGLPQYAFGIQAQ